MNEDISLEVPADISKQAIVPFKVLDVWFTSKNDMSVLNAFKGAFKESLSERIAHATAVDPIFLPQTMRFCGAPWLSPNFTLGSKSSLVVCMVPTLKDIPPDVQSHCDVILLTKESTATRSKTLSFCIGTKELKTVEDYAEVASRVMVEMELRNLPWTNVQHLLSVNETRFKRLVIMSEPGMGATLMLKLLYQLALQEEKLNIPTDVIVRNFGEVHNDFWAQPDCFFLFLTNRQSDFKELASRYAIPITKDSLNMLAVFREMVPPLTTELYWLHIPRCPSIYDLYVNHIVSLADRIRVRSEMIEKNVPLK